MKNSLLCLLLLVPVLPLSAQQPAVDQNSELLIVPPDDKFLCWHGHPGRTYFLQISIGSDPLVEWHWMPVIDSGNGIEISHEVGGTGPRGFYRLHYTDKPCPSGVTLEDWDTDGDGRSNQDEVAGTPQSHPLKSSTSDTGIPDGWAVAHGLDPNDPGIGGLQFGESGATNFQAFEGGVHAYSNANLTDLDGDGAANDHDADSHDRVVNWKPGAIPRFAMIELDVEDPEELGVDDLQEDGTILLSRIENAVVTVRYVIDGRQAVRTFLPGNSPPEGQFAGFSPVLIGGKVPGFHFPTGGSGHTDSLWDPMAGTFASWSCPTSYHDDIRDHRDTLAVGVNWLRGVQADAMHFSPDGNPLPGDGNPGSNQARIEKSGNVVTDRGYWRKNSTTGVFENRAPLPEQSTVHSATIVEEQPGSAPPKKWNLVAGIGGVSISENGAAFKKAEGELGKVRIDAVTMQGWAIDKSNNRIRANGNWYPFTAVLGSPAPAEVEILQMMDTGLAVAMVTVTGEGNGPKLALLLPVEITVAFGVGPTEMPDGSDQSSRELLEEYLDGIKVARQGDVWAVKGKDQQGNEKLWGVEIATEQEKLKAALSASGRHVVFDGHSNFGFGPDFLGADQILRVSDFTNFGARHTDVPLTFRKLIRNPQNPNDPSNFGEPYGNLVIPDNEIAVAPTNYKPLPINELRFENIDGIGEGQVFPLQGQGFETWHYRLDATSKRLLITAPKTDLPATLGYKSFFYNACSSEVDYIENFKHGDLIYTNESCFVHQGTKVFVQGIIEGKTTDQIVTSLNQDGIGLPDGEGVYGSESF